MHVFLAFRHLWHDGLVSSHYTSRMYFVSQIHKLELEKPEDIIGVEADLDLLSLACKAGSAGPTRTHFRKPRGKG